MEEEMEQLTQLVVFIICLGIAGAITVIAAVALFGPWIAPYMYYLPWKGF